MAAFRLLNDCLPVDPPFAISTAAGAVVTFDGRVRGHNQGRRVRELAYSAYPALAVCEGESIIAEAIAKFGLTDAACCHRLGALALGDVAVRVWAAAAHRGEAFAGCRHIIDEVKVRVPIWKRETYVDGQSEWVVCTHS
jgi:molybdopterin synthase catalytic subunit